MEVHFIAVKVSVVRGTHCQVEPEGVALHDTNFVHHHRHAVKRWLSVEDDDIAVDQVALDLKTGLRVAVAVQGGQAVLDTGALFAPLVKGTATVRAGHFEVLGEGLGVGVVGLSQLVHPAVVEDGAWVVISEFLAVLVKALQVVEGGGIVDDVADLFLAHAGQGNLLLNDQTWQEIGRWHDRVEVGTRGGLLVALGVVAAESCVDEAASCVDLDAAAVATDDVVHTGVNVRPAQNHLAHLLSVSGGHTDGDGEFLGDLGRDTDLVDAEVGVGRNHRASTEVDTLTGKVASEATFLPLEALRERLEGSTGAMTCRWDARGLVVKVGGDVVLQQLPQVLNDELGCTGVTVFSQALVDAQHVDELVGQVVFRPVAAVQGDGRANGDGWDWEHLENDPLWTVLLVHADEDEVLGRDAAEPLTDIAWVEFALGVVVLFLEGRRLVEDDLALGRTAVHADLTLGAGGDLLDFLDDLRKFGRTNAVLGDDVADAVSVVILLALLRVGAWRGAGLTVEQNVAAVIAGGLQRCLDQVHKPDVDDRKFQLDVAKVAWRILVLAVVGGTEQTGFDHTHVRVHQTLLVGVTVVLVGVSGLDFNSRHLSDFARVHQTKSNLGDSLGDHCALSTHLRSSSSRRMATPKLFISSRSSLNAYDVCTL